MEPPLDDFPYTDDQHVDHYDFARLRDGELTSVEEEAFFRHLDGCAACRAAYEAWVQDGRPSDLNNDT